MAELKEVKRRDKGVRIPEHLHAPRDPENIHLSKAQFIAKEKARKEKAIKIAEFEASLDKKEPEPEKKTEIKEEKKETKPTRGRPKKIE